MKRKRADVLVVEQGLASSRSRAQALILAGAIIRSNGQRIEKSGELIETSSHLALRHQPLPYVSRGGLKLEAAIKNFDIPVKNKDAWMYKSLKTKSAQVKGSVVCCDELNKPEYWRE